MRRLRQVCKEEWGILAILIGVAVLLLLVLLYLAFVT